MNREVKFVLFFIAIIISVSAFNFIKQHVTQNQFERLNTALAEMPEPPPEQYQQEILAEQKDQQQRELLQVLEQERDQQAQIADARLIEAIDNQQEPEENL